MPIPSHCPNPECQNAGSAGGRWFIHYGSYKTRAHGPVSRYRCRSCGSTMSDQTESPHYFAKLRAPLRAIWASLLGGSSQRQIARRYRLSPQAVHNAVIRLGRQAMGTHLRLLSEANPVDSVAIDGLRSSVTSQDYPCDITATVATEGEVILTLTHAILGRGGRMTPAQQERLAQKRAKWQPPPGRVSRAIQLQVNELWDYLRPPGGAPAVANSDEHPLYASVIKGNAPCTHFRLARLFAHRRVSSHAPRTMNNPLFPVNYVDLLLRHRLREHTRETIGFGRNAVSQMHRAWIFAHDHNCRRPYRERRPEAGTHAGQAVSREERVVTLNQSLFTRRVDLRAVAVPESIRAVWLGELVTPPVRWRVGQTGTQVHIPGFARRDLLGSYQQAG